MIIKRLNTVSNQSFNAIIGKNLQKEINTKREILQNSSNRKRSISVSKFDAYIKEIEDALPNLSIEIDKKNPKEYLLKYKPEDSPINQKIFRNRDEKSYQYNSLRKGLKLLGKLIPSEKPVSNRTKFSTPNDFFLIQPMLPTRYSREKREKLKQFEANILYGK